MKPLFPAAPQTGYRPAGKYQQRKGEFMYVTHGLYHTLIGDHNSVLCRGQVARYCPPAFISLDALSGRNFDGLIGRHWAVPV